MEPAHWSMIGLLVDVVGAFFLSAEAIKVENLMKIRDRFLTPLSKGEGGIFRRVHIATNLAGGVVVSSLVAYFVVFRTDWRGLFLVVVALLAIPFYGAIGILLAVFFDVSLRKAGRACVNLVDFIDRRTPDGGVGILGFLLLLVGFSLQFIGTVLSL